MPQPIPAPSLAVPLGYYFIGILLRRVRYCCQPFDLGLIRGGHDKSNLCNWQLRLGNNE